MSNTALHNQRLFAATLLFKTRQPNGVIFIGDNNRKQAAKFGMALDTFNKYLKAAKEKGLLVESGKNLRLISWHEIAKKLNILDRTYKFYQILLRKNLRALNLSKLTEWVRECLVFYKLQNQEYKIKKRLKTIDAVGEHLNIHSKGRNFKLFSKFKSEANSLGFVTDVYHECVKQEQRREIVTGCNHLSKLFGNCKSTMNKALNKLVKDNLITRKIVKVEYEGISNENFDAVKKGNKGRGIYPNYTKGCLCVIVGSVITLISNPSLSNRCKK